MTPAERLLAAADLLDKRAGEATEGPWIAKKERDGMLHGRPTVVYANGKRVVTVGQTRVHHYEQAEANTAYIATMHPEVGKALAKLLRREGRYVRQGEGRAFGGGDMALADGDTLALADLLLAGMS